MFDLQLEWTVVVLSPSSAPPLSLFLTASAPLVQIYFSPQPSASIKIKDGAHNIRYKNYWALALGRGGFLRNHQEKTGMVPL